MKLYQKITCVIVLLTFAACSLFYLLNHALWRPLFFSFAGALIFAVLTPLLGVTASGILLKGKRGLGVSGCTLGAWIGLVFGPAIYGFASSIIPVLGTFDPFR